MARGNGPKRLAKQAAIRAGDYPGVTIIYHLSETAESIAAYDPQENVVLGWNPTGWILHGAFEGATVEYATLNRSLDIETLSHIFNGKNCRMLGITPAKHRLMPAQQQ